MPASFRDPSGQLIDDGASITRWVTAAARTETEDWLASPLYQELCEHTGLIPAASVEPQSDGRLKITHRRITWPCYAFEWTPSMLAAAGQLTLDIQERAWRAGWTLKDASVSNVLFEDNRPLFCDLLSLRRRTPQDPPGWVAYGQFIRNFISPLLAIRHLGRQPRDIFLAHRDGLKVSDVAPHLPWHASLSLDMLLHVRLPAWMEGRRIQQDEKSRGPAASSGARPASDPVPWMLRSLGRMVQRLGANATHATTWSAYEQNRCHYGDEELVAKRTAVRAVVEALQPAAVLDLGANSGEFSRLAHQAGARVLALDEDVNALDALFSRTRGEGQRIQCLHANFARPTPAAGWGLQESLSLPARLAGQFDLILALAVVHHLAVTERLPLPQIFEALAEACRGHLLIEFVPVDDPRFVEIAGTNLPLYQDWTRDRFLAAAQPWFDLRETHSLRNGRELMCLARRPAP